MRTPALLCLAIGLSGCAESDPCTDDIGAWVMAKSFVEDRLKSPSSAKFPWYSEDRVTRLDECAFLVEGYVDAQNSFGATIRTDFLLRLKYMRGSDSYRLENLQME